MSIYRLGKEYGKAEADDGDGPEYSGWDKDAMYACSCDYGFTGPDCSLALCPKGDDPMTLSQAHV